MIVVVVGTIQGLFYAMTLKVTYDQVQMLSKGINLAHLGVWTHYGNLVSGGGNVPGSLMTAIVGYPLMVWDNPLAPQILVGLFHLISLFLIDRALKDFFTFPQRIVFICLFWLTPWRVSKAVLWNPSYLFFATALHLYTAVQLHKKPSFWMSFGHIIAIGFAFQLHASSILLVVISLYLFFRGFIQVNWHGVITAIFVIGMSLFPFFMESLNNQTVIPITDNQKAKYFYGRGLLYVFPLLKGILYWPRYTSMFFPSYIFNYVDFSWISNEYLKTPINWLFFSIRYFFGSVSMVISIWAFIWLLRRIFSYKKRFFRMESFIDNYILSALLVTVFISAITPITFTHWHLFLIFPVTYISFTQFLFSRFKFISKKHAMILLLSVCTYFVFYNIAAIFTSDYYSINNNICTEYQSIKDRIILK